MSKGVELQTELDMIHARVAELQHEAQHAQETLASLRNTLRALSTGDSVNDSNVLIAEHQRLLDQYMYRDRLVVQEFYFSIAATGLALNLVSADLLPLLDAFLCLAMFWLNTGLWIHIGHLRIDRNLMWVKACSIEAQLQMHVMREIFAAGYVEGPGKRRISATSLMVKAVGLLSLFWIVLLVGVLWTIDYGPYIEQWLSQAPIAR